MHVLSEVLSTPPRPVRVAQELSELTSGRPVFETERVPFHAHITQSFNVHEQEREEKGALPAAQDERGVAWPEGQGQGGSSPHE